MLTGFTRGPSFTLCKESGTSRLQLCIQSKTHLSLGHSECRHPMALVSQKRILYVSPLSDLPKLINREILLLELKHIPAWEADTGKAKPASRPFPRAEAEPQPPAEASCPLAHRRDNR